MDPVLFADYSTQTATRFDFEDQRFGSLIADCLLLGHLPQRYCAISLTTPSIALLPDSLPESAATSLCKHKLNRYAKRWNDWNNWNGRNIRNSPITHDQLCAFSTPS